VLQLGSGIALAAAALAELHVAPAIVVPMFFSHLARTDQPPRNPARAPFKHAAGAAAALLAS